MRRALWPLVLPIVTACTEWHPVALPTPADTAWAAEGRLRLKTISGRELRGISVSLRNDSLVLRPDSLSAELRVARLTVSTIERHGFSGPKTAVLGVVIVGVSVMMSLVMETMEPYYANGTFAPSPH